MHECAYVGACNFVCVCVHTCVNVTVCMAVPMQVYVSACMYTCECVCFCSYRAIHSQGGQAALGFIRKIGWGEQSPGPLQTRGA